MPQQYEQSSKYKNYGESPPQSEVYGGSLGQISSSSFGDNPAIYLTDKFVDYPGQNVPPTNGGSPGSSVGGGPYLSGGGGSDPDPPDGGNLDELLAAYEQVVD